MNDRLLKACRRLETDCRPIWIMRQAGRYLSEYREIRKKHDVLTVCKTPELSSEVAAIPVEKFGLDAAIIFADIMLPLESIGVSVRIEDNKGPVIANPIRSMQQVRELSPFESSEVSFVYEAIKYSRKRLNDSVPIIGFSGAPFTLASYMIEGGPSRDFTATKKLIHSDEDLWRNLMTNLSEMISEYLARQVYSGASALQLFDSWVGCLSQVDYEKYVLPYTKFIIGKLSNVGAPLIHFGTNTASLLSLMREAGGDVIGVDWRINIDEAWQRIGYDFAIQGNLDPTILLADVGTVERYAKDILNRTKGRPGHIFNLGHGALPSTPPENVKALVDFVHNYGMN